MNTKEILSLPAKEGLLFCHTFGKTLRGSDVHAFAVRRCAALMVCPVNNLFLYVHLSDAMGINLRTGYLFRVANNKGQIMPDAFPGSAVGNRLKKHLTTLRISDGETMHSFRSGCSITLSLLGASMLRTTWVGRAWQLRDTTRRPVTSCTPQKRPLSLVIPPHLLLRRFYLKPLALARYSVTETIYTISRSHFLNCNMLVLILLSPEYWRDGMMYFCFRGG